MGAESIKIIHLRHFHYREALQKKVKPSSETHRKDKTPESSAHFLSSGELQSTSAGLVSSFTAASQQLLRVLTQFGIRRHRSNEKQQA